jgi:hypothetical protein
MIGTAAMLTTDATNLGRLMNCNGSRLMAAVLPPDNDPAARDEGNAAHWLASMIFAGQADPSAMIDQRAPNGFMIPLAMVDHAVDYVKSLDCGEMECETSFGTDQWRIAARADHISWRPDIATLTIDDFKYGWRIVEPNANWTLIAHAIGYCLSRQIAPAVIILRIHQPRPHHPNGKLREWRCDYRTLRLYYDQINATLSAPTDTLATGTWCAKCHAEPTCPARRLSSYNAIDATAMAFDDMLSDDVLSHELDVLRLAKSTVSSRLDALEELASHRIKSGAVVPMYSLEHQYANTRWKTGMNAEFLSVATGIDCRKPADAITPAEFKRRGGSEAVIKTMTERPMTGTKLVRSDADARAKRLLGK